MLVDKSKRGTIILSHYRAGGTQMRQIVDKIGVHEYGLDPIDLGEVNFTENVNLIDIIEEIFKEKKGRYQIILINNPKVVSFLRNINYYEKLTEFYNIISLERKDQIKCLLSLPLWERFIQSGFFEHTGLWTLENMEIFHKKLIASPISWKELNVGSDLHIGESNKIDFINEIITRFISEINNVREITKTFKFKQYYYEEFENETTSFVKKHIQHVNEITVQQLKQTREKIPYPSQDYTIYFDKIVKQVLEQWNIKGKD